MLSKRYIKTFKLISLFLFFYVLIGALHGIAPGIWGKSFGGLENKGPFRILFFTPSIFTLYLLLLINEKFRESYIFQPAIYYSKNLKYSPPRRGPPFSSEKLKVFSRDSK